MFIIIYARPGMDIQYHGPFTRMEYVTEYLGETDQTYIKVAELIPPREHKVTLVKGATM